MQGKSKSVKHSSSNCKLIQAYHQKLGWLIQMTANFRLSCFCTALRNCPSDHCSLPFPLTPHSLFGVLGYFLFQLPTIAPNHPMFPWCQCLLPPPFLDDHPLGGQLCLSLAPPNPFAYYTASHVSPHNQTKTSKKTRENTCPGDGQVCYCRQSYPWEWNNSLTFRMHLPL